MSRTEPHIHNYRAPLGYREKATLFKVMRDPDFDTFHPMSLEREITWLYDSSTEIVLKNKGKILKSIVTLNDFYGFLRSTSEWDHLVGLKNDYDLTADSAMSVEMITTVSKIPVLEVLDVNRQLGGDDHFTASALKTDWRFGDFEAAAKWKAYFEVPFEKRYSEGGSNDLFDTLSKANPLLEESVALEMVSFSSHRAEDMALLEAYEKLEGEGAEKQFWLAFKDKLCADMSKQLPATLTVLKRAKKILKRTKEV